MIYTRWGTQVVIDTKIGEVETSGFAAPIRLVLVRFLEADKLRYQFLPFLIADGGVAEIEEAYNQAPQINPNSINLKKAIREAL